MICLLFTVRSWEIARILHAFDKLADNYVELLQAQTASDTAREEEQQHHLQQRALREASGSWPTDESEGNDSVLFSKEEEEEDDLMDSLVQDKDTLVKVGIRHTL